MEIGKIIGTGNTATVYQWGENKVLKLFHKGFPMEAIEREFKNAHLIREMDFAKPKAYEIILHGQQAGIVYDKVDGESLLDWVIRTENIYDCVVYMANLHKKIVKNKVRDVPNYKDFLKDNIEKVQDSNEKEEALTILDNLPEGDNLCHGDFHPGNIFIYKGKTSVIDFMNICHGPLLYDIARTIFLVQYTPIPEGIKHKEKLFQFKKRLADLYLAQMRVDREMIEDYLSVLFTARMCEHPNQRSVDYFKVKKQKPTIE